MKLIPIVPDIESIDAGAIQAKAYARVLGE